MLHIAPEEELGKLFAKIPSLDYLSGDIASTRAMERIDITSIPYPDESFDIIYCSHVLEHVCDDRKAIEEFYRVLRQGGWALIVVPIKGAETLEDMSVTDPIDRNRVFGHREHVRICGADYEGRLASAGFSVATFHVADVLTKEETIKYGIYPEPVFLCKK
jgi:SAM-dependent methyltransferase